MVRMLSRTQLSAFARWHFQADLIALRNQGRDVLIAMHLMAARAAYPFPGTHSLTARNERYSPSIKSTPRLKISASASPCNAHPFNTD
jgi:hypothetical protein